MSEVSKLDISAEDLAQFQKFLDDNKGKPRRRNVWDDLKTVNAGNTAQAFFEYLNLYGLKSALSHGSGLVFKDVVLTNWEPGVDKFPRFLSCQVGKPSASTLAEAIGR